MITSTETQPQVNEMFDTITECQKSANNYAKAMGFTSFEMSFISYFNYTTQKTHFEYYSPDESICDTHHWQSRYRGIYSDVTYL